MLLAIIVLAEKHTDNNSKKRFMIATILNDELVEEEDLLSLIKYISLQNCGYPYQWVFYIFTKLFVEEIKMGCP